MLPEDNASFVARHDPGMSHEALVEQIAERTGRLRALRETLDEHPGNLSSFAGEARALAGLYHVVRQDASEVYEFLVLMARAIGANAARYAPGDEPIHVDVGNSTPMQVLLELPRTQERLPQLPRLRDIADGYHAALATGDKPALTLLAEAPLERLAGPPPATEERVYLLPYLRGLQMFLQDPSQSKQLMVNAVNGCNSPEMTATAREYAQLLAASEIKLALLYEETDRYTREAGLPTFDEVLRSALETHRRYWRDFETNPRERLNKYPHGFLALGALAWATLRWNAGLPFDIRSAYLPESIVERHKPPGYGKLTMPQDTPAFVVRHDIRMSDKALIEQINEGIASLDSLRESLHERPRNLNEFAHYARRLAGQFHVVRPNAPEVLSFLRLMARAIGADAARHGPGDRPVQVDLGVLGPIEIPRTQRLPPQLLRLREVVDGYHAALAAGDKPALALLAEAPIERLAGMQDRVHRLPHGLGLQMLLRGDGGGIQLLLSAINGCNSPELIQEIRDYAQFLVSPEIELALLHTKTDQQARAAGLPTFDESLRNALVLHRRYWRDFEPNPGERQYRNPYGFIALGPLAWATLRRNEGLRFDVASEYLPCSMVVSHQ